MLEEDEVDITRTIRYPVNAMLLETACTACQSLEGQLSGAPPHDALLETDRRDMGEVTEGRLEGEVVLYRCSACGACFTRDLDVNDPQSHWEFCP